MWFLAGDEDQDGGALPGQPPVFDPAAQPLPGQCPPCPPVRGDAGLLGLRALRGLLGGLPWLVVAGGVGYWLGRRSK